MSVASITGASSVNEGAPYTLNLSATGTDAPGSVSDWTVKWGTEGSVVLPGNAASAGHTFDDGPAAQTVTAYRTNAVTSGTASDGLISTNDVAVDSLGRIVTVGSAGSFLEVRRFNANGTPDTTFSGDGVYSVALSGTTDARLLDVAIDGSNRIVAAGEVTTVAGRSEGLLARFDANGLDLTLNPTGSGGGQAGTVRVNFNKAVFENSKAAAVAIDAGGNILVGGTITDPFGTAVDFGLARYDASGAADAGFSGGSVRTDFGAGDQLSDVVVTPSGNIYAVGDRNNNEFAVAAYLPTGAINTAFAGGKVLTNVTGGSDVASNVAVDATGRVVVSGYANGAVGLVRYNANGTLDATFGTGGIQTSAAATQSYNPDQALENVVIDGAGNILVGTRLSNNSGGGGFGVLRYTAAGQPDVTFGTGGLIFRSAPDRVGGAIRLQADGGIVQAGTVPDAGNFNERNVTLFFYANASKGVSVQNVAPTLDPIQRYMIGGTPEAPELVPYAGDGSVTAYETLFFQFGVSDVSVADSTAGINLSFNWGDGSDVESGGVPAPLSSFASHAYTHAGTYTITITADDKDGGHSVVTRSVVVSRAAVQVDPVNGGNMLVVAAGVTSNPANKIQIKSSGGGIQAVVDGFTSPVFANVGRVVIYGNEGDDDIQVLTAVKAEIYGGAGDDKLKGGGLADALVGGEGDDMLVGGTGRDFLVGGEGADKIVGDDDDDILIGGVYTDVADPIVARFAVSGVMAEWTSNTTSYANRVDHLRHGTGATGGVVLSGHDTAAEIGFQTVFDDGAQDKLTGSAGQDWFFANVDGQVRDKIADLSSSEFTDSDRLFAL